MRPHRHRPGKWELLSLLSGDADVLIFDERGEVQDRIRLVVGQTMIAEIDGGEWHTVVFREPWAVFLEIKPGPYDHETDKEFASWAPPEEEKAARALLAWLEVAAPGQIPPSS